MAQYAIYLRKSRADLDAEARGEGETLARHRNALTQLASARGLEIAHIYEEIATGDTIADRPQMQALLNAVSAGQYAGVIVNDADRLSRGDGIDQGIVKQTFYSTGTLIITPDRIYDPSNIADEDFFELSLFMARFEYRKIKHRMQTGRARSAAEGNYLGSRPVFGYRRVKRPDRSGWTLEPDPEQACIVRMIFDWYANGCGGRIVGSDTIAGMLNDMGLRTYLGGLYEGDRVRKILTNPIYIGTVSFNKRVKHVRYVGGKRVVTRDPNPQPIVVENAHPAIVDRDLFDRVQSMFAGHAKLPKNKSSPVSNVLAGLVHCSHCGHAMQRKPGVQGRPDLIGCVTPGCPTTAIYIPALESIILDALETWRARYSPSASGRDAPDIDSRADAVVAIDRQIATLSRQLDSLHDLLEQGVYDAQTFVRRRDDVTARIAAARQQRDALASKPTVSDLIRAEMPQIQYVLDAYPMTTDLSLKNQLLKSVISTVIYHKTQRCLRNQTPSDYLEIDVFPLGVDPKKIETASDVR